MMRRFQDARDCLERSKSLNPQMLARLAAEAILAAAEGERETVESLLQQMGQRGIPTTELTASMTERILSGSHPQFSAVDMDEEEIRAFWVWFSEHRSAMEQSIKQGKEDVLSEEMAERLKRLFPFMERELQFSIEWSHDTGYLLTLRTFYMVALEEGYKQLLSCCPEEFGKTWNYALMY